MILCDTNIFIEIYRGTPGIIQALKQIGQGNVAVSDVTCAELLFGARNKRELQLIRKDLNKLTILPIQPGISAMAVGLIEQYSLSHKLALPDALIAATAIYYNINLYTLNIKDFKFLKNVTLHEV
jgi:tRNA(fMet)-specific endonuclease VapC